MGARADDVAQADNGLFDRGALDVAAFRDERFPQRAAVEARCRQEPGTRVDRTPRVVELERRIEPRQGDVCVVVGLDRADIGPELMMEVRLHLEARQGGGDDLAAEVDAGLLQDVEQHLARKDVNAHRGDVRLVGIVSREHRAGRYARPNLLESFVVRLLFEGDDLP